MIQKRLILLKTQNGICLKLSCNKKIALYASDSFRRAGSFMYFSVFNAVHLVWAFDPDISRHVASSVISRMFLMPLFKYIN